MLATGMPCFVDATFSPNLLNVLFSCTLTLIDTLATVPRIQCFGFRNSAHCAPVLDMVQPLLQCGYIQPATAFKAENRSNLLALTHKIHLNGAPIYATEVPGT